MLEAATNAIDRELPFALVHKLFASLPAGGGEWSRVEGPLRDAATGDHRALLELLQTLVLFSADRPVLVSVDDMHCGDEQSLRFFEHLAFRSHRQRLLVVATGAAQGLPGSALSPQALSLEATASLVCAALGAAAPAFCAACHRLAGGNPRFTHELVAEAAAIGLAPTAEHAWTLETLAPRGVAEAVGTRVERLTPHAGALTAALAVLGDGTPVGRAAQLAELDIETVERTADQLAEADVLAPERPLAFAQPIIRAALYGQLPAGFRAIAHRKAVRVLGQAGASAAAQAEHALAVEPAGDQVLGEVLLRAGEEALAAGTPRRAAQLLERSLAEYAMPERPTALVAALAGALMRLGSPRAVGLLREALALSPEPREKARLTHELIDALWLSGDPDAALALQRESDEGHPPGVRAATATREGSLPVPDVVSLARKGLTGPTAFERSCAVAALIACDELDEAERTLPEHVEVATRKGASAELAVLELLLARLSALAEGLPEPGDRFPGPDPGPSPWAAWPESVRGFGSVTAYAAGWMAVAARASGAARLDALQRAVGLLRESPRPLALAIALTELGRTQRQTGSRVAARETLREALGRAQRLGAAEVAEQAHAELRIAGARPRRESLSGPDSLTAGERRVVEAAARGLTNREIAAQLFLSTKTVEMHLSRSYRKLEIASRAELGPALTGLPLPKGTP